MKIARYIPTYNPSHRVEGSESCEIVALCNTHPGHSREAVTIRVYDTGDTMSACVYLQAATWTRCGSARLSKKRLEYGTDTRTFGSVVFLALKNAGVTGIDRKICDDWDVRNIVEDLAGELGYKAPMVLRNI